MPDPIAVVPAPWQYKGRAWVIPFFVSRKQAQSPEFQFLSYSPAEGSTPFARAPESGTPIGGIGFCFVNRNETPAGDYDELILGPGLWEYEREKDGRRVKRKNYRATRLYVTQEVTCWNGRTNWNLPKHLAKIDLAETPGGEMTVKVFPHDLSRETDTNEASPSEKPFFQCSYKPIRYLPSFPLSFSWSKLLGLDLTLVQPPLPHLGGSKGELPGTEDWKSVVPKIRTRRARLGWFDRRQGEDGADGVGENFWPGWGRWAIGIMCDDGDFEFDAADTWVLTTTE